MLAFERLDLFPGHGTDDPVSSETMIALQVLDGRLSARVEDPVDASGVVAPERQPFLGSTHGVAPGPVLQRGITGVGFVDVQPRDVADDSVQSQPVALLKGFDRRFSLAAELTVDRAGIVSVVLERLLQLADGFAGRSLLQKGFSRGSSLGCSWAGNRPGGNRTYIVA